MLALIMAVKDSASDGEKAVATQAAMRLLDGGVDVDAKDSTDGTNVEACTKGFGAVAQRLLDIGCSTSAASTSMRRTARTATLGQADAFYVKDAEYAVKTVAIKVSATHLCEERIRAGKRHSVSTLKLDYRLYKTQPLGYITLTWVIRFRSLTIRSCLRYNADLHAK